MTGGLLQSVDPHRFGVRPGRRTARVVVRTTVAVVLTGCIGAARPVALSCPVTGMDDVEATLELTQSAGRILDLAYYAWRPTGESMRECSITAGRGKGVAWKRKYPSQWTETPEGTRVVIMPSEPEEKLVTFTPRANGTRLTFETPFCGTFELPEAIELRWNGKGCQGQAIGWHGYPLWPSR